MFRLESTRIIRCYDARMTLDCFSLNLFQLKKFVESKHQKKVIVGKNVFFKVEI
jgi:hypothetical protein